MEKHVPLFALERRESLLLKGIAILLVLLGHLNYYSWGGAGGVVLFLLVSGYGIHLSFRNSGRRGYWKKRLLNVWLAYVPVGALDVLILRASGPRQILCTLLGLDLGVIADKTMWYISFAMLWYAIYYVLAVLTQRLGSGPAGRIVLPAALLLAAAPVYALNNAGFWSPSASAGLYVLAFPFGVLAAELGRIKLREAGQKLLWMVVIFLSTAYLWRVFPYVPMNALSGYVMAAQALALVQLVPIRGTAERVLGFFGRYSYPIYLFEGVLLWMRGSWFERLELRVLIDLAYLCLTLLAGVVYGEIYGQLKALLQGPPDGRHTGTAGE